MATLMLSSYILVIMTCFGVSRRVPRWLVLKCFGDEKADFCADPSLLVMGESLVSANYYRHTA